MSLVDYNSVSAVAVRRERALAEQKARPAGIRRTPEQQRAFENSDFMKKCREHQLAVYDGSRKWDAERRKRDPEFNPRDDDFDAPPVRARAPAPLVGGKREREGEGERHT